MKSDISRRDFIKTTSAVAAGVSASVSPLSSALVREQDLPKVVIAIDEECTDNSGNVDENRVQDMVDHAVMLLTGNNNTSKAYEALFPEPVTSSTTIMIKENGISGKTSKSYQIVLNALKTGLTKMLGGTFPEDNITITIGRGSASPTNPSFTIGPRKYIIEDIWIKSDYIINVPVCWANTPPYGVTLSLKNMMSTVGGSYLQYMHGYEQDANDPWLSKLNSQETFMKKHVITLIDAIMGRYKDGPGGSIDYKAHRIIVSRDTIACDYQGVLILKEKGLKSSLEKTGLEILDLAAKWNVGTEDFRLVDPEIWDPSTEIKSINNKTHSNTPVKVITRSSGSRVTFTISGLEENHAELSIFDIRGRKIWVGNSSGLSTIVWPKKDLQGKAVAKGEYIYKVKIGNHEINGKVHI